MLFNVSFQLSKEIHTRFRRNTRNTTYNEAESEPWMALDDTARIVAAVVAPAHESFISFHFLAESVLAARENQAHDVEGLDGILDSLVELTHENWREFDDV